MFKRSFALLGAVCLAAVMAAAPAYAQRTKLTLYTAIENDQLGPFKQTIEAAVPDVEIVWVRDSTGVITARFPRREGQSTCRRGVRPRGHQPDPVRRSRACWRLTSRRVRPA